MPHWWWAVYGTGLNPFGVAHTSDGRVLFTVWVCFFNLPLVPVSSWSAARVRPREPVGSEANLGFDCADLRREPHDPARLLRTLARGWLLALSVLAPLAVLLHRTDGRAATWWEFALVMAVTVWAAGLMLACEFRRDRELRRQAHPGKANTPGST
jgi:hypothetical protein